MKDIKLFTFEKYFFSMSLFRNLYISYCLYIIFIHDLQTSASDMKKTNTYNNIAVNNNLSIQKISKHIFTFKKQTNIEMKKQH